MDLLDFANASLAHLAAHSLFFLPQRARMELFMLSVNWERLDARWGVGVGVGMVAAPADGSVCSINGGFPLW